MLAIACYESVFDMIESRVLRNGPIQSHCPELGPCWTWSGTHYGDGYPRINIGGKHYRISRVIMGAAYGDLDRWEFACHACDNPGCIRPSHLFVGTPADNMQDKARKGRALGAHQGVKHHNVKLTPEIVLDIRQRYADRKVKPITQKELGLEYGIHQVQVSEIVLRKTWAHLQ